MWPALPPEVRDAFGLDPAAQVSYLPAGWQNECWRVREADRSVLIRRLLDADPARVVFRQRVVAGLGARGFPVPPAVLARSGESLLDVPAGRFEASGWVSGQHRSGGALTAGDCSVLGVLLAELHLLLADTVPLLADTVPLLADTVPLLADTVPPPADRGPPSADTADRPAGGVGPPDGRVRRGGRRSGAAELGTDSELPALIACRLAGLRARTGGAEAAPVGRLLTRARHWHQVLSRIAPVHLPTGTARPSGWTHGDVQPLNLLWSGGRVVALLDWDDLAVRPWSDELVRTAMIMFGPDLERAGALVRSYLARVRLQPEDLAEALGWFWWRRLDDLSRSLDEVISADQGVAASEDRAAVAAVPAALDTMLAWWCAAPDGHSAAVGVQLGTARP